MALYEVEVEITKIEGIIVEADSVEEAQEIACRGLSENGVIHTSTYGLKVWNCDTQQYEEVQDEQRPVGGLV